MSITHFQAIISSVTGGGAALVLTGGVATLTVEERVTATGGALVLTGGVATL